MAEALMFFRMLGDETLFIGRPSRVDIEDAREAVERAASGPGGVRYLRGVLAQEGASATVAAMKDAEVLEALAIGVAEGRFTLVPLRRRYAPAQPLQKEAAASPKPKPAPPPSKKDDPVEWLEIKLVDDGDPPRPMAGVKYRVELDNGDVFEGNLDDNGEARLEGLSKAKAKVTFPDIDADAWDKR